MTGLISPPEMHEYLLLDLRSQLRDPQQVATVHAGLRLYRDPLLNAQPSLEAFSVADDLAELPLPVLVVTGDDDPLRVEVSGPRVTVERLASCEHFPFVKRVEAVLGCVESWLAKHV